MEERKPAPTQRKSVPVPFRPRKRILPESNSHNYNENDFLKGTHFMQPPPVGGAADRQIRFKCGFYRRPQAAIKQDEIRTSHEELRASKLQQVATIRCERIREMQCSRNPVSGEGVQDGWHPSLKIKQGSTLPSLNGGLSHFQFAEAHIRQRNGDGRYHVLLGGQQTNRNKAHYSNTAKKFSSDLGYNREDITSLGVSDNFMPMTDAKVERTSTKKSNKAFDVSEKWFFHDDRLIPPKVAPPISAPPPFATSLDL